MKRHRVAFMVLAFFLKASILHSQEKSYNNVKIIPPSPEAFSMTKYGDLPIGLFTGTFQFNVPIYHIKNGNLSHDVSLDYATNGVKVDEVSSRVGVNWSLKAGGVITRKIRGMPDGVNVEQLRPANHSMYSEEFWSFLYQYGLNQPNHYDTQPDIFTFSVDGFSGDFIIDNGQAKQLKKSAYVIKVNPDSTFVITSPKGDVHKFGGNGAISRSSSYSQNDPQIGITSMVTTAWYLTESASLEGDVTLFEYDKHTHSGYAYVDYYTGVSNVYHPDIMGEVTYFYGPIGISKVPTGSVPRNLYNLPEELSYLKSSYQDVFLSSIKFKAGSVNFRYSNRLDLPSDKKLEGIDIKSLNGEVLKTFALNHTYSESSSQFDTRDIYGSTPVQELNPYLKKRLFFTGLVEVGQGDLSNSKTYEFEYEDINGLCPRISFAQDLFGYFNGKVNNRFFPNNTYLDSYTGYRLFGADRNYDYDFAKKGVLKKIIYPTKGTTLIEYEPHLVFPLNSVTGSEATTSMHKTNSYTNEIFFSDTLKNIIEISVKISPYWDDHLPREPGMGVDGIYTSLINVATNEVVAMDHMTFVDTEGSFNVSANRDGIPLNGDYVLRFRAGEEGISFDAEITVKRGHYTGGIQKPIGGLRVKSISNDDGKGIAKKTKYLYSEWATPDKSTGVLMGDDPEYKFIFIDRFSRDVRIENQLVPARIVVLGIQSSSVFDLYQNGYNSIVYENVIEVEGENSTNGGIEHKFKIQAQKFPKFAEDDPWYPYCDGCIKFHVPVYIPGVQFSNTDFLNGKEIYKGVFTLSNGQQKFVQKEYFDYSVDSRNFSTDTLYAVKRAFTDNVLMNPRPFGMYDANQYLINYYWTHLDSTKTITYSAGDSIIVKKRYRYENLNNLEKTQEEYLSSKKDIIKNYYRYPGDKVRLLEDQTGVYQNMVELNVISPVIEHTIVHENPVTHATKPINSIRNNYSKYFDKVFRPSSIEEKVGTGDFETRMKFLRYDNKGNLLSLLNANGMKVNYLWAYGVQYPIAEIKNVDYSVIETIKAPGIISTFSQSYPDKLTLDGFLSDFRIGLPNAQITTFSYKPLIGMVSSTDAKGMTTYYEYDSSQRLKYIKDQDANILKSYDYHFKP